MSKPRVQVQGLGPAPTVQPVNLPSFQYGIAQPQAGTNNLLKLAGNLEQFGKIAKGYAGVVQQQSVRDQQLQQAQAIQQQEVQREQDKFDHVLLKQHLNTVTLPSLQQQSESLVDVQKYTKRDQTSQAIDEVINKEWEALSEALGGDVADSLASKALWNSVVPGVKAKLMSQYEKNRKDFVEDMYIQGLNQDFGERAFGAETKEQAEELQADLKERLDLMVEDKIPRSRAVELLWNGFAVPNIRGLLAGDNPQPEKAERILDHLTKIDLTGDKGFLGNINREGAAIRSGTATFRDKIAQAREKIESDVDDVAKRIVNEYTIASNAIQSGPTGNEEIDNRARREIARQLQHAGYSETDAGFIAEDVYTQGDVAGYTRYLSRFLDNDVTREAFGKAARSFGSTRMQQLQLSSMYITQTELPQLIERFEEMAKTNPNLTSSDFLSSGGAGFKGGPIMDKSARAAIVSKELELDKKKWWENSKAKQTTTSSFNNSLKTTTESLYMQQGKLKASRAQVDQLMELGREADFKTRYETLIREASDKIDPDEPNREELMLEEEKKIAEQLQGRWKRLQETIKTVSDQERKRQAFKGFDPAEFNQKLEEAERDLRDLEPFWAETIKESIFEVGKYAGVFEEVDDPSLTLAEKDYAFREMTGATSPMRAKALEAADKFDKALLDEPRMIADFEDPDAPATFKETSKLLRKRFGYSSIDQVPDFDAKAPLVDWRMTPIVAKVDDLRALGDAYINELIEYHKLPLQEQNIEDSKFSTLRKMRDKFGIFDGPTEVDAAGIVGPPNLMIFISSQRSLFNK